MARSGALVLLSGGIDSALVLDMVAEEYEMVHTLHVTYGQQTAEIERSNAEAQAQEYGAEHHVVDLSGVVARYATGVADPDATFTEQERGDGRSSGYVPMRNLLLLSIGAGFADAHGLSAVAYGAQANDQGDYPDCRPEFVRAAQRAVSASLADGDRVDVLVPLLEMGKTAVIVQADRRGVRLDRTYSCYRTTDPDDPEPCGHCPACVERQEAFEAAGVEDPTRT